MFSPLLIIDGAVDQMGKQFMHNALPPYLLSKESARSVASGGEKWSSSKNRVVNRVELDPDTEIRLIRANCLRLVTDFNAEVDVVANDDKDTVSKKLRKKKYILVGRQEVKEFKNTTHFLTFSKVQYHIIIIFFAILKMGKNFHICTLQEKVEKIILKNR